MENSKNYLLYGKQQKLLANALEIVELNCHYWLSGNRYAWSMRQYALTYRIFIYKVDQTLCFWCKWP